MPLPVPALRAVLAASAGLLTATAATPAAAAPPAPPNCVVVLDTATVTCYATRAGLRAAVDRLDRTAASSDLGAVWSDGHGGGSQLLFRGSQGCAFRYPEFRTLPAGWNDVASSATGYGGCRIYLYEHTYWQGIFRYADGFVGDLNNFNDRTSSVHFS
ncbi:hypothetical protein ABT354_00970 [Streptomyces sp. NPDC000594]|uniref:hypothetical protein n=1 Tax=Streptomyces sp. NPDC000594 TaxID=3154261 RepID=UPI00332E12BF